MKSTTIVILSIIVSLLLVDYISLDNELYNKIKSEQHIRFIVIVIGAGFALYSEYYSLKSISIDKPPTYEESVSSV